MWKDGLVCVDGCDVKFSEEVLLLFCVSLVYILGWISVVLVFDFDGWLVVLVCDKLVLGSVKSRVDSEVSNFSS